MKIKHIFPLLIFFLVIGCIEDRVTFARLEIDNQSASDIIYVLEWKNHNSKTSDTIFMSTTFFHEETLLQEHLDELISIEFIKINDSKNVIYFPQSIDENNYTQNINRTIFNVDNWNEFARDDYEYKILETDFD